MNRTGRKRDVPYEFANETSALPQQHFVLLFKGLSIFYFLFKLAFLKIRGGKFFAGSGYKNLHLLRAKIAENWRLG